MQNENNILVRRVLPDEFRELLKTLVEIPSLMSMILDSIGKIETQGAVYHCGLAPLPEGEAAIAEYYTLVILPDTIRTLLEQMAGNIIAQDIRNNVLEHWTIPGAHFIAGVLQNADQIYRPEYNLGNLQDDVHAYKNLITRVQNRLPKHTFCKQESTGKATRSGLWCSARHRISITSEFTQRAFAPRPVRPSRRSPLPP